LKIVEAEGIGEPGSETTCAGRKCGVEGERGTSPAWMGNPVLIGLFFFHILNGKGLQLGIQGKRRKTGERRGVGKK